MPGSASMAGSSCSAWRSASARSAVSASSGPKTSVCRHVMMVSRPNTVMNHGMPAAGSRPTPSLPRMRSAARSADRARVRLTELAPRRAQLRDAQIPGLQRAPDAVALLAEVTRARRAPRAHAARLRPERQPHVPLGVRPELEREAQGRAARPSAARELRTSVERPPAGSCRCAALALSPAPATTAGGRRQRARRIAEREVVLLDGEDVGEVRPRARPPISSVIAVPARFVTTMCSCRSSVTKRS